MSFDNDEEVVKAELRGLNPFGTGQCLSTWYCRGLCSTYWGLNPFGTGQCLSTIMSIRGLFSTSSLNPFGTGQCLSTFENERSTRISILSQSLWNRAMSFDCSGVLEPCVARLPRATSQLFLMFE